MSVYVVSAYRWGLRDCHSYVVGAREREDDARALADAHVEYRGGKYGCEVVECDMCGGVGDGRGQRRTVYYRESPYFGAAGHGNTAQPVDKNKESWTYDSPAPTRVTPESVVGKAVGGK